MTAALAVLLVLGAGFWVVQNRASSSSAENMDVALQDLDASIAVAEAAVTRARTASDALASKARAAGDHAAANMAEDASVAADELEASLEAAQEVSKTGQAQEKPSQGDVESVEEAASDLDALAADLEEVTVAAEDKTEQLDSNAVQLADGGSQGSQRSQQAVPQEQKAQPSRCLAPVAGAYPCAGGPVPAEARHLPEHSMGYGITFASGQSPTGNITCDVLRASDMETHMVCTSLGNPKVYEEGYPTAVLTTSGPVQNGSKGDPMASKNSGHYIGNVLPYGTVWYSGDFVMASDEAGLTIWNASTGYGALLNRSGLYKFG